MRFKAWILVILPFVLHAILEITGWSRLLGRAEPAFDLLVGTTMFVGVLILVKHSLSRSVARRQK